MVNDKKRIAIVAREMFTSTGRYSERLVHYLQKIDTNNEYLILLKPEDMHKWEASNPNFHKIACPHKEYSFDEQLGLKKQLNKLKPDLVHFVMPQQPVLYKGPVVTTMQDLTTARFYNPDKNRIVFWLKQRVYIWLLKAVAKKSLSIITISEFVKKDVINFTGIEPDKITVTLESSDLLEGKPEAVPLLKGKQFIMYVGRPTPHKNLARLIDAFASLKEKYPNLHLVLVGKKDFNYRNHEKRIIRENIQNVIFTDFVSDQQLKWLYQNTAVYCFPSLSEGFGLPGLEAMRHGAPVVSSDQTSLPEVHGDAAHYFDPYSTASIAKAIDEVLQNDSLRSELVKKGSERVKLFSWERMAKQTLEVYKSALKHQ